MALLDDCWRRRRRRRRRRRKTAYGPASFAAGKNVADLFRQVMSNDRLCLTCWHPRNTETPHIHRSHSKFFGMPAWSLLFLKPIQFYWRLVIFTCHVIIEFSVLSSCWVSNCWPWNRHPVKKWSDMICINCALITPSCTNQHIWYLGNI